MSERDALQGFLDKWRARWPEWSVAQALVPEAERECVQAWFALRDELAEAAWGGDDATPGEAKLGWWAEELDGWGKGARRHPLGLVLQKQRVDWPVLAAGLASLRASRTRPESLEGALQTLVPYANALSAVASRLFDAGEPAPVHNVAVSLLGERVLGYPASALPANETAADAWARQLLLVWPAPGLGTRPGRIHAAIVRGRLERFAKGHAPQLPRFSALLRGWRAARG